MLVYIYTQFLNPARSKARVPGFDRVTKSAGSIPILKKIQNDVVLVKKKKQKSTGCNWVFDRVNWVMTFPIVFNPIRFQPRVDPPGRAEFQNYGFTLTFSSTLLIILGIVY